MVRLVSAILVDRINFLTPRGGLSKIWRWLNVGNIECRVKIKNFLLENCRSLSKSLFKLFCSQPILKRRSTPWLGLVEIGQSEWFCHIHAVSPQLDFFDRFQNISSFWLQAGVTLDAIIFWNSLFESFKWDFFQQLFIQFRDIGKGII